MLDWQRKVVEAQGSKVFFWIAGNWDIQLMPSAENTYVLSISGEDDKYVEIAYFETLDEAKLLAEQIQAEIDAEIAGETDVIKALDDR
jgi:hypothetical protein